MELVKLPQAMADEVNVEVRDVLDRIKRLKPTTNARKKEGTAFRNQVVNKGKYSLKPVWTYGLQL